ncbi:MAG: DUF1501 domain-containing protein [Polyangiaceae bacterium]|nr:DUF1501 domain-containing protein [Polyangiaceae bacterium]
MERREALKLLFGASGVGLAALSSGLPASFLVRPLSKVSAQAACDAAKSQYLIMSISGQGDGVNANVPGSYAYPDIVHAPDPSMAKTPITLAGKSVEGAKIWSTLPQNVLDRTAFIHHSTMTNNHPNLAKVMRMMGATNRSEMIASIAAKHLSGCFQTIQPAPVSVGAGSGFTYVGRTLPNLQPTALRDLLAKDATPLGNLQALRDKTVDGIYGVLKTNGTRAQLAYLDSLAQSRTQARSISADLLQMLSQIDNDSEAGQILAAVALIKMNVAPAMLVRFKFGSDNHSDQDLMTREVPEQTAGVGYIASLMQTLAANGLQDKVTFAMMNVFGRTLKKKGMEGRDHWAGHHVTVMIGKNVKGGVVGGLVPTDKNDDYIASAIDSATGLASATGDVSADLTLSSTGKTLNAVLGVPNDVIDMGVTTGKVFPTVLAG